MTAVADNHAAAPGRGEACILIADDSSTNVFILTAMLRTMGLTAVTAANGSEAVALATTRRPALIFMDIQMPRMDGMAAARQIRDALPENNVTIVAVTAHPDSRHLPEYKSAAFDDLVVKPIDFSIVRRVIEKWMSEQ